MKKKVNNPSQTKRIWKFVQIGYAIWKISKFIYSLASDYPSRIMNVLQLRFMF